MSIVSLIQQAVAEELNTLYELDMRPSAIQVTETKPEFEGDYTVVLFGLIKRLKISPDTLGNALGKRLQDNHASLVSAFNLIKGFLNLSVGDEYWRQFLMRHFADEDYGRKPASAKKALIEYSSPNTNKPLHLGHLRNNFLGWSIAEIFRFNGYEIKKTCIANDRGIHICKSMIAWQLFGNGATPESTGIKGDHLVGDFYVLFGAEHKKQVRELVAAGMPETLAEKEAPIMKAAQQMLVDWEAGKPEVIGLWKKMNEWVYEGFHATYQKIGSDFDKIYYESEVYLLGKKMVEQGIKKGVFFTKEDGSVWIDLTQDGLDEKIVQRKDGTAVYITQDIGLAALKQEDFGADLNIYVVGNEQDYHFKVLKLIAQKLGIEDADGIHHLSYGMVELPTGKMKTREGTVVDADEIVAEMEKIAEQKTQELGKVKDFTETELASLYATIGLGALKFFLLRVDPKRKMLFNPEESIDFQGFTGPFIQYTYARTRSILRKETPSGEKTAAPLLPAEKKLLIELEKFGETVEKASAEMDPSVIANYVFTLAQTFNSFAAELRILTAETPEKKELRLQMAELTAHVIKTGMRLLGIRVPEKM